ncbi:hypothetical protein GALMADRAFT_212067 [Galerina marginata CBS 339.88]|uniref:Uncharacterized protein n=1 Tax=Galerina marginata (strain CBS 339.88) TaxID=685588 RepID=A0A067SUF0_GALM3|nr:hypothetical protein GALMADRAFT_212067 [Galerina marginata CBS 339.88]
MRPFLPGQPGRRLSPLLLLPRTLLLHCPHHRPLELGFLPLPGAPLRRPPQQFAIDTTKFHETRSVLEPEANALWKLARQNVNTDWRRIINHPDLKLLHGYPIFPPSILMNDKPGQPEWRVGRTLQYAVAWLVIRVAWFSRTTNRLPGDDKFPIPQDWRDFLWKMVAAPMGFAREIPVVASTDTSSQLSSAMASSASISSTGGVSNSAGGHGAGESSRSQGASRSSRGRGVPRGRGGTSSRGSMHTPPASSSHHVPSPSRGGAMPRGTSTSSRANSTSYSASGRSNKRRRVDDPEGLNRLFKLTSLVSFNGPTTIYWDGREVISKEQMAAGTFSLSSTVMRQIVWDLLEHNFRMELLALDRCLVSRAGMNECEARQRDRLVYNCFMFKTPLLLDLPRRYRGLGAANFADRVEVVEAFRILLSSWPGEEAPRRLKTISAYVEKSLTVSDASEESVRAVETVAYPFYCQTFFDYFGRAPSIPHQLPEVSAHAA